MDNEVDPDAGFDIFAFVNNANDVDFEALLDGIGEGGVLIGEGGGPIGEGGALIQALLNPGGEEVLRLLRFRASFRHNKILLNLWKLPVLADIASVLPFSVGAGRLIDSAVLL